MRLCPGRATTGRFDPSTKAAKPLKLGVLETGLMDETYAAWRGAKWIGADELGLAARAKAIFSIELDFFQRVRGGKA